MNKEFNLGKVFNIDLKLDASWFLIFLLVTLDLALGVLPALNPFWSPLLIWGVALTGALLFFGSILAHELAHSLMAIHKGIPVKSITLFLFGGVANIEQEPESPKDEFWITLVGPLTSYALGGTFLLLGSLFGSPAMISQLSPLATLFFWLGSVNLLVGTFNLIPGYPLDGGRILHAGLWWLVGNLRLATKWASGVGQGIGWLFILGGVAMVFGISLPYFGAGFGGLWLAFIGWFLKNAAKQTYEQLLAKEALESLELQYIPQHKAFANTGTPGLINDPLFDSHLANRLESQDEDLLSLKNKIAPKEVSQMKQFDPMDLVFEDLDMDRNDSKVSPNEDSIPVIQGDKLVGFLSLQDLAFWMKVNGLDGEVRRAD